MAHEAIDKVIANAADAEERIKKAVIEAGAEITLKAGGSFVKIDPSGVAMGGASIKMNAGGAAGKGSGQKVQVPEMPGLVAISNSTGPV